MSKTPNLRSTAYGVRSVSELADALKRAESQLDLLGDAIDGATAARLRRRIARARHDLDRLGCHEITVTQPEIPPFWRKILDS